MKSDKVAPKDGVKDVILIKSQIIMAINPSITNQPSQEEGCQPQPNLLALNHRLVMPQLYTLLILCPSCGV